jgi:hypothetical protein
MFKFISAFRRTENEIDARVDEWIAALKEDVPTYPRDARDYTVNMPRSRGAHRKPSMFESLNTRST